MIVFALLFEHHAIPCTPCFPCADPGFFVRGGGGPGQSDKKSPDNVFFSPQLILLKSNGTHFSRFQRGSNIFQGVPTLSKGVQLLIPYRNPYNVIFQGGPDPLTPLWIRTCYLDQQEIAFFPFSRRWVVFFSFI